MARYRQSGGRNGSLNGVAPDYVSLGVRGGSRHFHHRRRLKASPAHKISVGFCVLMLSLILSISALFYFVLHSKGVEISRHQNQDDDMGIYMDFLTNVTWIEISKDLNLARDHLLMVGFWRLGQ